MQRSTARGHGLSFLLGGINPLLASVTLLLLLACGVPSPPSEPPTSTAPATVVVAPATRTAVPAGPSPTPTTRPSPTLIPAPTVGQAAVVSTVAASALTVVPALEATSAAVLPTVVAGIVDGEQTQEVLRQVAALLGGVRLEAEQSPPGAVPIDTTRLLLRGSDTAGNLARLQPLARQFAAQAALTAAGQIFPNAIIELVVQDGSGTIMLHGTRQPGYQPEVTVSG